jgi:GNAT superfamily N-acetyltransferase
MVDPYLFNYITYSQIEKIEMLHPIVHKTYLADRTNINMVYTLTDCPDIFDDFPCFFYLSDGDRIVSSFGAIPDTLYSDGRTYRWAWAGSLFTDPVYRGRGIATYLVENMVTVLHQKDIAWGGVFSTPTAIKIYKKLGFTIPGYANRYVILKRLKPLLNSHINNGLLVKACDRLYRGLVYLILPLINKPNKPPINLGMVERFKDDIHANLPKPYYHTKYHFNDSYSKLKWKLSHNKDMDLYLIKSTQKEEYLCYFVIKNRRITSPIAERYSNFKLLTLMDYGVYNDDDNTYTILLNEAFNVFWKSDADVFEIISSSRGLNRAVRYKGMIRLGKGMSFKFCVPMNWNFDDTSKALDNWPLTHFCGDGFSFE